MTLVVTGKVTGLRQMTLESIDTLCETITGYGYVVERCMAEGWLTFELRINGEEGYVLPDVLAEALKGAEADQRPLVASLMQLLETWNTVVDEIEAAGASVELMEAMPA